MLPGTANAYHHHHGYYRGYYGHHGYYRHHHGYYGPRFYLGSGVYPYYSPYYEPYYGYPYGYSYYGYRRHGVLFNFGFGL